jgi:hypothetical protein
MHIVVLEIATKSTQENSAKRKRSVITLETKRQIIDASVGKTSSDLSKQFSLPAVTIRSILGKKAEIINAIDQGNEAKRARLRPVIHQTIDDAVLLWNYMFMN